MLTDFYAPKIAVKSHVNIMEHANYKASLKRADRLTGEGEHGLPPGASVPVYPIASLPGTPAGWIREAGTYVCPVASDWGLWFDWTMNDDLNTAILPSVKGMNPITGQRITTIDLEQYQDKCPIHGCDLSHERFCEKCGYKLPPQNYVCSPNTLWWDGFRQPDGSVRQFFFTEDAKRDIASAVIGKKNTVPAFGFAFFATKEYREQPVSYTHRHFGFPVYGYPHKHTLVDKECYTSGFASYEDHSNIMKATYGGSGDNEVDMQSLTRNVSHFSVDKPVTSRISKGITPQKKIEVSVGGGAKIRQNLQADVLEIDGWKESPSAIIRLYFVFENEFKQIVKNGGVKDISGDDVGYLKDLPLG